LFIVLPHHECKKIVVTDRIEAASYPMHTIDVYLSAGRWKRKLDRALQLDETSRSRRAKFTNRPAHNQSAQDTL
jgi:hypothetical protein